MLAGAGRGPAAFESALRLTGPVGIKLAAACDYRNWSAGGGVDKGPVYSDGGVRAAGPAVRGSRLSFSIIES